MSDETFCWEYEVAVETSKPEPDVNWPGSTDVVSVLLEGKEIIDYLPQELIDELAEKAQIALDDRAQDEYAERCDWLYEQQKDRFLERRYEALDRAEREVSRAD